MILLYSNGISGCEPLDSFSNRQRYSDRVAKMSQARDPKHGLERRQAKEAASTPSLPYCT